MLLPIQMMMNAFFVYNNFQIYILLTLMLPVVIDSGATVNIVDIDTDIISYVHLKKKLCPLTFGCLHMVRQFH